MTECKQVLYGFILLMKYVNKIRSNLLNVEKLRSAEATDAGKQAIICNIILTFGYSISLH